VTIAKRPSHSASARITSPILDLEEDQGLFDLPVLRVLPWSTTSLLLEVGDRHLACRDTQPPRCPFILQDVLRALQRSLLRPESMCSGSLFEVPDALLCSLDSLRAALLVEPSLHRAAIPDDSVTITGQLLGLVRFVDLVWPVLATRVLGPPDLDPRHTMFLTALPERVVLEPRSLQNGDEGTALPCDVSHVLPCAELRVCDVEKARRASDLSHRVPGLDVRLVVVRVAVVGLVVHRHGAIRTDGEGVDELLEIGTVILVVSEGDQWRPTPCLLVFLPLVRAAESDRGRVVVDLGQVDLELLHGSQHDGGHQGRSVDLVEPIERTPDPIVVQKLWRSRLSEAQVLWNMLLDPGWHAIERLPRGQDVGNHQRQRVRVADLGPATERLLRHVLRKQRIKLEPIEELAQDGKRPHLERLHRQVRVRAGLVIIECHALLVHASPLAINHPEIRANTYDRCH